MEFDPRAPEFRADPYPFYDMLRSYAPIFYWEPWGLWFMTSHEDCQALLRDDRLGHEFLDEMPPSQQPLWDMQARWMLTMNPPDHTRLRGLVYKAFTPRTVAQLRESIQQTTDELIDAALDRGEMDLIRDFAYPLPVTVICSMLGVPAADHIRFHDWSDAIARSLDLTEDQAVYERATVAAVDVTAYLADLLAERRARPQDDLLSALVAVEEAGDRLSADELYATCALLLIAGHETTVNLLGNGTQALLRNRGEWDRLRADAALTKTAVEELLRYDSAVQLTSRAALQDISYKGIEFAAGTGIAFILGAANRDPAQFNDPWRLDIGREPNRHLAFGGGIHYCLGAPLARLEGEIAFATLARRLPNLDLTTESAEYKDNYVLRGLASLPVTF
jgi:cytochrome P450